MSMIRRIEVETIQSGQPRPYADHIYESYITFSVPEGQMYSSKWPSAAAQVVPYAQLLVAHWDDDETDWFRNRLVKLEQVSIRPNKWHVIVTSPYLD